MHVNLVKAKSRRTDQKYDIEQLLKVPIDQVRGERFKAVMNEFNDMLQHANCRRCEVTFIK